MPRITEICATDQETIPNHQERERESALAVQLGYGKRGWCDLPRWLYHFQCQAGHVGQGNSFSLARHAAQEVTLLLPYGTLADSLPQTFVQLSSQPGNVDLYEGVGQWQRRTCGPFRSQHANTWCLRAARVLGIWISASRKGLTRGRTAWAKLLPVLVTLLSHPAFCPASQTRHFSCTMTTSLPKTARLSPRWHPYGLTYKLTIPNGD